MPDGDIATGDLQSEDLLNEDLLNEDLQSEDLQSEDLLNVAVQSKEKPPCKGCSADVNVSEKQIQRILKSLDTHPDQCIGEEIYKQRMTACAACPSLAYGTTCMHCGCFVAVRAKFIKKGCPHPGHPYW